MGTSAKVVLAVAVSLLALAAVAAGAVTRRDATVSAGVASPGNGATCPPQAEDEAGGDDFDAALDELVQSEADALGERFAGADWASDGSVTVRVTGGDVPQALRDHPKVRVAVVRFSVDRLDAAMETVATRLNALLAPGVEPGTPGAWPWEGSVDVTRNIVAVQVDPDERHKDAAIRTALADELLVGTVQYCYQPIQPVSHPIQVTNDS